MPDQPDDELAAKRKAKRPGRPKPGPKRGGKAGSAVGPISSDKAINAARKQSEAVQLRIAGASLAQIAARVGYADPSGAHQAIMSALRAMLPEQERDDARRLEIAKLDRLEMAAWNRALAGGEDADKAASTILRCITTRAKLLGLEAPAQLDVRVREGELVRVEILEVLNDETLAALKPFQEEMVRLSELRAGAIDVTASE